MSSLTPLQPMRVLHLLVLITVLADPGRALAHGGTSHSSDMTVDNQIAIGASRITLVQVHHCSGKLATDLWAATDTDGDGKLSDAEWARCVVDSRTVYQQWCRLEVDWKTVLPARVNVELVSFPRSRPASFAGAGELTLRHEAHYETPGAGEVRNVGLNCTSLNARTIRTVVRCDPGMRVETTSFGQLAPGGAGVDGMVQQDGMPDQIALVVREVGAAGNAASSGSRTPPARGAAELAGGLLLLAAGFFLVVSRAVALGRAQADPAAAPPSALPLVPAIALFATGAFLALWALVRAGWILLNF